jgi:large subunit ribosomal protein L24
LICPECGDSVRVGYQILSDGKKVRVCKSCSATIDK